MENLFEFKDLEYAEKISEIFVVMHEGEIVKLDKKISFNSYNKAKSELSKIIEANYHQGHYWHRKKNNVFTKEGGKMRLGGKQEGLDEIFKGLTKELVEKLLIDGTFVIKSIS